MVYGLHMYFLSKYSLIPGVFEIFWKRYDYDKFAFFKPQTEHKIQFALNSYNKNIRIFNIFNIFFIMFEYELEQENRVLLFLTFKIQKSVSKGTLTHISTKNER